MKQETHVEFRLVDDEELPPIMITMNDDDNPKVVLNARHKIWLSLHRKTIGGCAEALFTKINDLLSGYLREQRAFEMMDDE
jgi:hypothetical protein|tara:strand:+ start:5306 stop:5548 length:243 start_codon:yes stop_codon:yes gene_type:complete